MGPRLVLDRRESCAACALLIFPFKKGRSGRTLWNRQQCTHVSAALPHFPETLWEACAKTATMQRFCQRCRRWRDIRWITPGTPTYCDPCRGELSEQKPTATQDARQQRGQLQRRRRIDGLIAWVDAFKQQRGCRLCEESDPSCLDCQPVDPATKTSEISKLIQKLVTVEVLKKELEKCVVICSNCHRKHQSRLREEGGVVLEDLRNKHSIQLAVPLTVRHDTLSSLERRRRSMIAALLKIDAEITEMYGRSVAAQHVDAPVGQVADLGE
jgi:hypothetical protein